MFKKSSVACLIVALVLGWMVLRPSAAKASASYGGVTLNQGAHSIIGNSIVWSFNVSSSMGSESFTIGSSVSSNQVSAGLSATSGMVDSMSPFAFTLSTSFDSSVSVACSSLVSRVSVVLAGSGETIFVDAIPAIYLECGTAATTTTMDLTPASTSTTVVATSTSTSTSTTVEPSTTTTTSIVEPTTSTTTVEPVTSTTSSTINPTTTTTTLEPVTSTSMVTTTTGGVIRPDVVLISTSTSSTIVVQPLVFVGVSVPTPTFPVGYVAPTTTVCPTTVPDTLAPEVPRVPRVGEVVKVSGTFVDAPVLSAVPATPLLFEAVYTG
jgi:hypothetical protein